MKTTQLRKDDLDDLYQDSLQTDVRPSAFKTVELFGNLIKRKLELRDEATASTSQGVIYAPFKSPFFYTAVEHELAHLLFESDPLAKRAFIKEYVAATERILAEQKLEGLSADELDELRSLVSTVVGVIEDARIYSLWSMMYAGSAVLMRQMHQQEVRGYLRAAHRSLESFFVVAATGLKVPQGPFSQYEPVLKQAMAMVERKSFTATLVVSKWLVNQVVTLVLKNSNTADPQARVQGLKQLLEHNGTLSQLLAIANDWDDALPISVDAQTNGRAQAQAALQQSLDSERLNAFLNETAHAMERRVGEIVEALSEQQKQTAKDWVQKSLSGPAVIHDPKPATTPVEMGANDEAAVARLRSLFYRVMSRKRHALHEAGSTLDVSAFVAARVARRLDPCFREEERGRGFKVVVLLDRSSSMQGQKTQQAERACRMLVRALRFPFVEFHVWGFTSLDGKQLQLTRFSARTTSYEAAKVDGFTPLHLAMEAARAETMLGTSAKQIIVITDGWPAHLTEEREVSVSALLARVRKEVQTCRRRGTNVTLLAIGNDMDDTGLNLMMGARKHWQRLHPKKLSDGVVRAVAASFTQYLRNG